MLEGKVVAVTDAGPAEQTVAEIRGAGGKAHANLASVADPKAAASIVDEAVETFGRIDAVVNNAGILRDTIWHKMSYADWTAVLDVHLNGAFNVSRAATPYFREQQSGSFIHFTSTSGLIGNVGQTNYGAAKAGIAAFTVIAAQEMADIGVRVNAIAPAARTRLTEQTPGLGDMVRAPEDPAMFDLWDPDNAAPLVAWLATRGCPATGRVFFVQGGEVKLFQGWTAVSSVRRDGRWTVAQLEEAIPKLFG
jgi:NAD(P)-dependent dehydrogenase (short-subunit alcohol dehydrogenase family)